jgi:hypothetical protein
MTKIVRNVAAAQTWRLAASALAYLSPLLLVMLAWDPRQWFRALIVWFLAANFAVLYGRRTRHI